jgi:DNA-binding GntR family transcriptional regulator
MTDRASRSDEIFNVLKARIIRWDYPPSHRLTEDALCAEFGVSRIPVREALHMLVENNLVDRVPHRGCTVKQPNLDEIHELYEVRLALELFVVEQLAQRGLMDTTYTAQAALWQELAAQAAAANLPNAEALARHDEAFHETLAAATGNSALLAHLRMINERLLFMRMTDITTPERLAITCRQHVEVLDRIAAGEVEAARAALRANIDFGRHNVESALKDALARAYLKTA